MIDIRYFRRFRMEIPLLEVNLPEPVLPAGYFWSAWHPELLMRHAAAKFESFRSEMDARIFSCFTEYASCLQLMEQIACQSNFLPRATWLLCQKEQNNLRDCATIQGVSRSGSLGAIQNVGVVPDQRGLGLGRALMLKSLLGFREAGMKRVSLQVTADNKPAVKLYRSLGFQLTRTLYKAVEVEEMAY